MSIARRAALAFLALGLAGPVAARAASGDDKALADRVEAFRAAQVAADAKALETLCAPELSYSHSDGRVEDRAAFVAAATTGKNPFTSLEYRSPQMRVVGDTATVRFNWVGEQKAAADGKVSNTNLHVLMVWIRRGDAWNLLARSATRL